MSDSITKRAESAYDNFFKTLDSKHIEEQLDRIMPVLLQVMGTANCPTRENVKRDLAVAIEALRRHPEADVTHGLIRASRVKFTDELNFDVLVPVTTIYGFQMWTQEERP